MNTLSPGIACIDELPCAHVLVMHGPCTPMLKSWPDRASNWSSAFWSGPVAYLLRQTPSGTQLNTPCFFSSQKSAFCARLEPRWRETSASRGVSSIAAWPLARLVGRIHWRRSPPSGRRISTIDGSAPYVRRKGPFSITNSPCIIGTCTCIWLGPIRSGLYAWPLVLPGRRIAGVACSA